tara:strand:- start:170 stop:397 length:228 start_codon:yes stop_codon:yes gene_type:complete
MPGLSLSVVYSERTKGVCADSASGCLVVLHFFLLPAPAGVEGGIKGREKELFFQEIDALLARSKTLMPKNRRGPS